MSVDIAGEAPNDDPARPNPDLDGLMNIELQDIIKEARTAGFGVKEVLDALTRAIAKMASEELEKGVVGDKEIVPQ